jgi:3-isopropylmalate/(R)-2-methylmalate dehydratase small subunit
VNGLSQAIKDGKIKDGDELEVDLEKGEIKDLTNGNTFHGDAVADLEMDIMKAGGLIEYLKEKAVSK